MSAAHENARAVAAAPGVGKSQTDSLRQEFITVGSPVDRILAALLSGRRVTHLDCWREFGSARLSAHVFALRRLGWPVEREDIFVPTSDGQRRALIGVFRLPAGDIAAAGERGRAFAAASRGSR